MSSESNTSSNNEVRYHMLRPAQIVERRKECPVAYIPVGNLEWHGVHNPVGADTLQAEGFAVRCARKGGGLAFPPLYYGESRSDRLMEASSGDSSLILKEMELDPDSFSPDNMIFTPAEQFLNYQKLLLHVLNEVETLGFKVGVIIAGHYPLIDHTRAAVLLYNQSMLGGKDRRSRNMLAWACVDYLLLQDKYSCAGDHAGGWETSHVMALHPGTVDLSLLPPKGEKLVGAGGRMEPQDSNTEFGEEIIEAAVDIIISESHHRLNHPEK